jgi:hypothetical protein
MKIYLLVSEFGEYDDYSFDIINPYLDLDKANDEMNKLNELEKTRTYKTYYSVITFDAIE